MYVLSVHKCACLSVNPYGLKCDVRRYVDNEAEKA